MQGIADQTRDKATREAGNPPWDRVAIAPPAEWVVAEPYDAEVRAKAGAHLTHLLWVRQVEAEAGQSFHATAVRLETPLAVQHESQWRLDLDARNSRLTLHWLRVVRGGVRIDQLRRERMRLMQRETQLDHHVIDGSWTLLLVLEDVRAGDIIEAGYSFEWVHPIRPGGCEAFFVVPPQATVGRYHFGVTSAPTRTALRWKSSEEMPAPREESLPDGRRRWDWEGAQLEPREPETNQPSTHFDHQWVQVSDLADYGELAARVERAWAAQNDQEGLAETPGFARPETVNAAAILALIRQVQDGFRYLSMDLETSGWIPSSPGLVARRRHGDCKDLAWLAATVLRGWGVAARPVLVGTGLRERVGDLLPMAMWFNHAILEVEHGGELRWFDLTCRDLGGDFSNQAVGWFGRGLVVGGAAGGGLRAQPGRRSAGKYERRETVLLDTRRSGASAVEVRLRAEGWQADSLRRSWLAQGAERFAKEREEQAQRRLGRARRVGELRWRDDREANVCELAEAYEVLDAAHPGEQEQRALFDAPANLVMEIFLLPEGGARRGPWEMPFPFELAHEVTVKSAALGVGSGPRRRWSEPEFDAMLECVRVKGAWTNRTRFRANVPEIAAERLPVYRRRMGEMFRELGWRLYLPWGQARGRRGDGFGELGEVGAELVGGTALALAEGDARPVVVVRSVLPREGEGQVGGEAVKIASSGRRRRNRPVSRGGRGGFRLARLRGWPLVISIGLLVGLASGLGYLWIFKK